MQDPESDRFAFGANWQRFLLSVDNQRVQLSSRALEDWFGVGTLEGRTFLDVGCGSGLSSLAAHRLGASVRSFDFDPDSVQATSRLRTLYAPDAADWVIERGSVLDPEYLDQIGRFDIVYSWGVLHHTGSLWAALGAMPDLVAPGGYLMVSLYNAGWSSSIWARVKGAYVRHRLLRPVMVLLVLVLLWGPQMLRDFARRRDPLYHWRHYGTAEGERGMSAWTDLLDWIGGYPFEASTPGDVFTFLQGQGMTLVRMSTVTSALGCNQYLFTRASGQDQDRGAPPHRDDVGRGTATPRT